MHVILIMIRYSNCGGYVCIAAIWHFFFLFFFEYVKSRNVGKKLYKALR